MVYDITGLSCLHRAGNRRGETAIHQTCDHIIIWSNKRQRSHPGFAVTQVTGEGKIATKTSPGEAPVPC